MALIDELIAVATRKDAATAVQDCYATPTALSGADEPRPVSPKVAWCPREPDHELPRAPLIGAMTAMTVEKPHRTLPGAARTTAEVAAWP